MNIGDDQNIHHKILDLSIFPESHYRSDSIRNLWSLYLVWSVEYTKLSNSPCLISLFLFSLVCISGVNRFLSVVREVLKRLYDFIIVNKRKIRLKIVIIIIIGVYNFWNTIKYRIRFWRKFGKCQSDEVH